MAQASVEHGYPATFPALSDDSTAEPNPRIPELGTALNNLKAALQVEEWPLDDTVAHQGQADRKG